MSASLRFVPWFCGLPCAPMTLQARGGRLAATEGGCPTCREEVAQYREAKGRPRAGGREVPAGQAIEAAASLLMGSRSPFVFGLSRSSSSTAMRAARLASAIGAALDVEGAEGIQSDLTTLATFGLPSATFGEIRDRADLVLLWRCDPRASHPGLFAAGPRPSGDGARRVVLLPPPGGSGAPADRILRFDPATDLDAALALRALAIGRAPGERRPDRARDELDEVASWLRRARYSAIVWDAATAASPQGVAIVSALTLLARDLNAVTRSVARPLGAGGNVAGAVAALAALTGYPRAVGFAGGTPRFAPGEFDAGRLLAPDGADVLLLVGARSAEAPSRNNNDAPGGARRAVRGRSGPGHRSVVIGPRLPHGVDDPDVWIPTATPGLSSGGTATRSDGVTVVLKSPLSTHLPTEDDVLDRLLGRCTARTRSPLA